MLQLNGHVGTVHALTFTPNGQTLISAGRDRSIRLWDLGRGKLESTLSGHLGAVFCLSLSSDGRMLASGGEEAMVRIWDIWSGQILGILPKQIAKITGLAWFPHKQTLAIACGERLQPDRAGELQLCNLFAVSPDAEAGEVGKTPPQAPSLRLEKNGIWCLAIAEGPMLAFGGGARAVTAWDLKRKEPTLVRQSTNCLTVALSRDGKWLAASADRVVKLYDVQRAREIATLEGHKGMIRALAFSPDGHTLATGSADKTIRFWSVGSTGPIEPRRVFEWPIGGVHSLAYSPDGMVAAAAGDNGTIVVWDVDV
ncbi:MAG TPA: WD40 repeat domain-containing protein [Gemmataceae bacterium]|nr:WD40 repeat domain-containing protein [Gemmataceae bacterium]